jgi:GNAT superfamily N-acetyltransferase
VRNYCERVDMLAAPGDPVDDVGGVTVAPVDGSRIDAVLDFFDHDAFADNPGWSSCYCMAHHIRGGDRSEEWAGRSWETQRADLAERLLDGRTTAVVAEDDGRVVGWCNASARSAFPDEAQGEGDEETGVAVCFVIAPAYRGHGLAGRLLDAAVQRFDESGLSAVEGHPKADPSGPGAAYRGTRGLFERAGFEVSEHGDDLLAHREL